MWSWVVVGKRSVSNRYAMPPCEATASITNGILSLSLLWVMISITAGRCWSDILRRLRKRLSPTSTDGVRGAMSAPRTRRQPSDGGLERCDFAVGWIRESHLSQRASRERMAGYLTDELADAPEQPLGVGHFTDRHPFLVGRGDHRHDGPAEHRLHFLGSKLPGELTFQKMREERYRWQIFNLYVRHLAYLDKKEFVDHRSGPNRLALPPSVRNVRASPYLRWMPARNHAWRQTISRRATLASRLLATDQPRIRWRSPNAWWLLANSSAGHLLRDRGLTRHGPDVPKRGPMPSVRRSVSSVSCGRLSFRFGSRAAGSDHSGPGL